MGICASKPSQVKFYEQDAKNRTVEVTVLKPREHEIIEAKDKQKQMKERLGKNFPKKIKVDYRETRDNHRDHTDVTVRGSAAIMLEGYL